MSVHSALITTTLLLEQLKEDGNQAAWRQFDERFRGVVLGAARKIGLDESDAADVAQETMLQSLRDYKAGRYDRSRGRLSSWIIAIAHHRITDLLRRKERGAIAAGDTTLREMPAVEDVTNAWSEALQASVFRSAWEAIQSESHLSPVNLRAFELAVIRSVPPEAVASECGISVDQVYVAKSRVSTKLKEIVERLTLAYEDGL
ncbi:MAG: sigma-70 family RNA polymerase sigma factor [Phycisphaeraceae bacterium]|nr:sigma-70 family RNA polymerase sigma factor [Phycisphaeraceae bacterium]